jgi:hypothetical protein
MSSLSRAIGAGLLAVVLVGPLAACTGLRPVYSDAGLGAQRVDVAYAAPGNRLERLIYQDLALRLGKAEGAVPLVRISASSSSRALTSDIVASPLNQRQVTVSATLTVTAPDGTVLFSGTRSQTADLTHGAQVLANEQATATAERQAAELLADTLRLEIIAALST